MPEAINLWAARAAKMAGAKVCLNAAPYRPLSEELAQLVDLLVVNAIEAEQLGGVPVTDLASAAVAAQTLGRHYPGVIVTAGGDGVAGVLRGEEPVVLAALPVKLVSTHGAGDTFVGSLVAALAAGLSFTECLRAANEAAAVARLGCGGRGIGTEAGAPRRGRFECLRSELPDPAVQPRFA